MGLPGLLLSTAWELAQGFGASWLGVSMGFESWAWLATVGCEGSCRGLFARLLACSLKLAPSWSRSASVQALRMETQGKTGFRELLLGM